MRILLKGMSMNDLIKLHIHQLVQDFLRRINQNDRQGLLEYNQVTDVMLKELYEELNNSFDSNFDLSIIPLDQLPEIMPENMPLFDIDQMNDGNFIIESNIYNFKKITDLKLQVYVVEQESSFILFDPLFRW